MKAPITWSDFEKVEIRAGRIERAEPFPEARKPAYKLWVDLGPELGMRTSSAQITDLYSVEELAGKFVICVVNFPPKQIGPVRSECLVTGLYRSDGKVVLAVPDREVEPGALLG